MYLTLLFFQYSWLISTAILLFGLFAFILLRKLYITKNNLKVQSDFLRQLLESQEHERKKLVSEMHDNMAQNILIIKNSAMLSLRNKDIPESIKDRIKTISEISSTVLNDVRNLSHNLRPFDIDKFGITEAIKSAVEKVSESVDIKMESRIENIDSVFTKETEINLYRIIQESFNNIIKYSKASECSIIVEKEEKLVKISIMDNGTGFDLDKILQTSGTGVRAMEERVKLLNGQFKIDTSPGQGTKIHISIPSEQAPYTPALQRPEVQRPVIKTESKKANNLPEQTSVFIGREKEIFEIRKLLSEHDVVTMTGPGGIGKTSLSMQAGLDSLDDYEHGVWIIELAALKNSTLVINQIASVFNQKETPGKIIKDVIIDYLKEKELLIILDNCEHLRNECAEISDSLRTNCPKLKILATSREPLGLQGEEIYRISPLTYPVMKNKYKTNTLLIYESVKLFIEQAASVKRGFSLTDSNAIHIAHICNKLEGIPLAIELAAARVGLLPVESIFERLNERFNILTGGKDTVLPRQQTLMATIEWSYNLLDESEQALLNRLSVFSGGWKLESAEEVCNGNGLEKNKILDTLSSLVSKSLIIFDGETFRYDMLETIREYASKKLKDCCEEEEFKTKHLEHYSKLAEEAEPHLIGEEEVKWHKILDVENYNIRYAFSYCLRDNAYTEKGLYMAMKLKNLWEINGNYTEALELFTNLLHNYVHKNVISAKALLAISDFEFLLGNYKESISIGEQALNEFRLLNDKKGISSALYILAVTLIEGLNDFTKAESLFDEALTIRRELGDKHSIANGLSVSGSIASGQGNNKKAEALFEEAIKIYQEIGNKHNIAYMLVNIGNLAQKQGDYNRANSKYENALRLFQELGNKRGIVASLVALGNLLNEKEDWINSIKFYEEALIINRELHDTNKTADLLTSIGDVCINHEDYDAAQKHFEDALVLYKSLGSKLDIASIIQNLGKIKYKNHDFKGALLNFKESLKIFLEIDAISEIEEVLRNFAEIAQAQNYLEQSTILMGAAEILRERMKIHISSKSKERINKLVLSLRNRMGEEEFTKIWAEGRTMSTEEAIELALNTP